MRKWVILGAIGAALLLFGGIVTRTTQRAAPSWQNPTQVVRENDEPNQVSGDSAIRRNAEGKSGANGSRLPIGSVIDTGSAMVYVSNAEPSEDKRFGKQMAITLEMVGKGETAQPLPRVMQFYLEDSRGRWTPVSGREARWQEAFLLPTHPLRITLIFRGLNEGDSTFALDTSEGKTIVPLVGKDMLPPLRPFQCENSSDPPLPLQVEIRRVWRVSASPMAQPLPDYQFLALELVLSPTAGYAPHLQLSNVLLTEPTGNQYPATPYALPINEQLAVCGELVAEKSALVGFEVPLNANPHCLVIIVAGKPVYVPLPGG